MNPLQLVEGLLFVSGQDGLRFSELREITQLDTETLQQTLKMLEDGLQEHGFFLQRFGQVYKLMARPEIYPYAQSFFEQTRNRSLSKAAMETLAIVAYSHPITRTQIEEIRGVSCDSTLRSLLSLELVETQKNPDQRAVFYVPGAQFLDFFGLHDLEELPAYQKGKSSSLFDKKDEIKQQVSALFQ